MGARLNPGYAMLYLVACGIDGSVPDEQKLKGVNFKELYKLSVIHKLSALVYTALSRLPQITGDNELNEIWHEDKNKAVRKNLMLDVEREQLFAFLEEEGIWHVPLKGIILKSYYPGAGLRQMSDNDVLFDLTFAERVKSWFIDRGYECEEFGKGAHDAYLKPPVFNFEMHRTLFTYDVDERVEDYYRNVRERLILKQGKFGYGLSKEDLYVYLMAHAYKHWASQGTGLRTLLDFYVFLNAETQLDEAYIAGELEKLGIPEYEKATKELALKIFKEPYCSQVENLEEEQLAALEACLYSGAYGSRATKLKFEEGTINGRAKRKYYLRRLFPSKRLMIWWCESNMPAAAKHKFLLPLAYIWRILKGGIFNAGKTKREINAIRRIERAEKAAKKKQNKKGK